MKKSYGNFMIVLIWIAMTAGITACKPVQNDGGKDWASVSFYRPADSYATRLLSIEETSIKTSLIIAVPENVSTIERDQYLADGLSKDLENLAENAVTLSIPIDTPIRLKQLVFKTTYTLEKLIQDEPEAECAGVSDLFTISSGETSKSVYIELSNCADRTAPSVVSTNPENGTTAFDFAGSISVVFDETMDASSITANSSNTDCSGTIQVSRDSFSTCIKMDASPAAGSDGKTFTVTPASNLKQFASHSIRITTAATDTVGNALAEDYTADFKTRAYNATGNPDTSFAGTGYVYSTACTEASDVVVDASDRILIVGTCSSDICVLRYLPDGTLDPDFGTNGIATFDTGSSETGSGIAIDSNGYILVTGDYYPYMVVARFKPDGTPDNSFGSAGYVTYTAGNAADIGVKIKANSDGTILVAGHYTNSNTDLDYTLWRYDTGGSPDAAFGSGGRADTGSGGDDYTLDCDVDSSGNIYLTGYDTNNDDLKILRFTASGTWDSSFNGGTGLITYDSGSNDRGTGIAIDGSDNIVVTGYSETIPETMVIRRYKPDGSLDTSFNSTGYINVINSVTSNSSDNGYGILIDNNGNILVAGTANDTTQYSVVWRYTNSGDADATFGTDGLVYQTGTAGGTMDKASAIAMDSDGRIIVVGGMSYGGGLWNMTAWRYK